MVQLDCLQKSRAYDRASLKSIYSAYALSTAVVPSPAHRVFGIKECLVHPAMPGGQYITDVTSWYGAKPDGSIILTTSS